MNILIDLSVCIRANNYKPPFNLVRTLTILLVGAFLLGSFRQALHAQDVSSPDSNTALVSGKYLSSINKTAGKLESSLDKKTEKILRKLQQQENRIYKKLQKTGSVKAQPIDAKLNPVPVNIPRQRSPMIPPTYINNTGRSPVKVIEKNN